jgi:hypothetical protein
MNIVIATLAANGMVTTQYVASLHDVSSMLNKRDIKSSYHSVTMADIEMARNYLASHFLANKAATHLLFVDADMGFRASLIARMIDFSKDFVSTVYVKREMDVSRLLSDLRAGESEDPAQRRKAVSRNMQFVGRGLVKGEAGTVSIERGFARFEATGMGICLLSKNVFDQILTRGLADKHPGAPTADRKLAIHGFFDRVKDGDDILAEDYSFCSRWTHGCGGEIWACVDEPIDHIGAFKFTGVYLEKIMASPSQGE